MAYSVNHIPQGFALLSSDTPLLNFKSTDPIAFCKSPTVLRRILSQRLLRITASVAKVTPDTERREKTTGSSKKWREFAGNVSGEWDGYGADFTIDGKPVELPESVVPEAYREWEVKVYDWQTQCPTLAEPEEPVLLYKMIKLLPSVGCEADAASLYSVDERIIGGVNNEVSAFAYHESGCYVSIWNLAEQEASRSLELEHCLVDPRNRESRTRVIQVVQAEKSIMKLRNIQVFREQWYGPFRNGEQLGGCAIRDSGFASTDPLQEREVLGIWQGTGCVASFENPQMEAIQELVTHKPRRIIRGQPGLILLPKQVWCSIKERENGELLSEVGWLLGHGLAQTSACVFSKEGKLKEIELCREATISNEMPC